MYNSGRITKKNFSTTRNSEYIKSLRQELNRFELEVDQVETPQTICDIRRNDHDSFESLIAISQKQTSGIFFKRIIKIEQFLFYR